MTESIHISPGQGLVVLLDKYKKDQSKFTELKNNLVDVEIPQYTLSHTPKVPEIVNIFIGKSTDDNPLDTSLQATNQNQYNTNDVFKGIIFNLKKHIKVATKQKEDAEVQNDKGGEENGVKEEDDDGRPNPNDDETKEEV